MPPQEALTNLEATKQVLALAISAFSLGTQLQYPWETAAALDREAYDLDPQETRTYAKFLAMP